MTRLIYDGTVWPDHGTGDEAHDWQYPWPIRQRHYIFHDFARRVGRGEVALFIRYSHVSGASGEAAF